MDESLAERAFLANERAPLLALIDERLEAVLLMAHGESALDLLAFMRHETLQLFIQLLVPFLVFLVEPHDLFLEIQTIGAISPLFAGLLLFLLFPRSPFK